MTEELIVHFKELPVFPYEMDYLTCCKRCGSFNLANKPCIKCNQIAEITLEEMTAKKIWRQLLIRELVIIGFYAVFLVLAKDWKLVFVATCFTLACLGLNLLIHKKYQKELCLKEVERFMEEHIDQIKVDLGQQMSMAIQDVEAGNPVDAYDRFRYLGKLMDTEEVRIYKLICLRHFKLRSDMPLELKTLLQEECNTYLIDYIYEVSKLKKSLIDDATLSYIVQYKEQVLMKHKGKKIMASILEGALKSKFLLNKYAGQMQGYLSYFSKERLLRLCKLQSGIKDENLRIQLMEEVEMLVGNDERFERYLKSSKMDT